MIAELTNHLWQSTLFAVAAGLLTLAFRKNRAQVRYWLWFSASIKFFVPFSPLLSLGSELETWAPAAKKIASETASFTIVQVAQPFPDAASFVSSVPAGTNWTLLAILAVWLCGFAAIALTLFRAWLSVRAAVRSSSPLAIAAPVDVRSSPGLLEPGVVGLFRPVLLLPAGIVERLTPSELEAVLAHELCHIRRRDNLTSAIHMIVEAVFWFHPLVWWIGARLVEERELACDEEVLRLGSEPRVYAEGILNVCKLYVESPLRCVSGVTGSNLKRRVRTILTGRVPSGLNLAKKLTLATAAATALAVPVVVGLANAPLRAQSGPAATARFEVASIKPCGGGGPGTKMGLGGGFPNVSPGRLNTACALLAAPYPMAGLIQRAYGRLGMGVPLTPGSALPVSGGPKWIYSDSYVINAKAPDRTSEKTMEGPMLQALLEDRFKLKVHRETRQLPVYALTVGKGGSKLQRAVEGSCVTPDYSIRPMPPLAPGKRYCLDMVGGRNGPNTTLKEDASTIDYICKLLGLMLDRPVIDKTGIPGKYRVYLEFAVDQTTPGALEFTAPPSDEPPAPSIFTVVEQQLGLKLEATKGPREFLVIDRVERPSEN
jgi:bla regulator protein BlaR1